MLGRRVLRSGQWAAAVCFASCITRPGRAQDHAETTRYAADASCPDQSAFFGSVDEKLARAGVPLATLVIPKLAVELHASDAGFRGALELERVDGTRYAREVDGASCREVANALAFVLALALSAKEAPAPPTSAALAAVTPPAAPPPPPAAPPPAPPPKARPPEREPSPSDTQPARARDLKNRAWGFGGGVQLGARAGIAPSAALLESAVIEARQLRPRVLAVALRAAFVNAPTVHDQSETGSTEFSWWSVRLELCPARLALARSWSLVPCLATQLGRLHAAGAPTGTAAAKGRSARLWAEAVSALRLEVSAAPWLSLQMQGEVARPLTRYEFAFDSPNTPIYRVPALATAGFVGLSARFP